MALTDLIILGGTTLLLNAGLNKEAADWEIELEEKERRIRELRENNLELERAKKVNEKRKYTRLRFDEGVSFEEFEQIAVNVARKLKRVTNAYVDGGVITCVVESQTGYSEWEFSADFNDWGHLTGTFWTQSDNDDSTIPSRYGILVSREIHSLLESREIRLIELSEWVDRNKKLETEGGLNTSYKEQLVRRVLKKEPRVIKMEFGSNFLLGEHLYPVISILRKNGFKNIKAIPVQSIDAFSPNYLYEVGQILINRNGYFEAGNQFVETAEIIIYYYDKRRIRVPFPSRRLKRKHFEEAAEILQSLGFLNVYIKPIEDIVTGWIVKEGSVEEIVVGILEEPIRQNSKHLYDEPITIYYHTSK